MSELPIVQELSPVPSPLAVLKCFANERLPILMESTKRLPTLGRYSFFSCDPIAVTQRDRVAFGEDPFADLRPWLNRFGSRIEPVADLPPFQGGIAGLLGYELGHAFERLPIAATDPQALPVLCVGLYDWVIAWDHERDRCWIISQGISETDAELRSHRAREHRARKRCDEVLAKLRTDSSWQATSIPLPEATRSRLRSGTPIAIDHTPHDHASHVVSNFSHADYLRAVSQVVEYIRAGDIFQANLSQQLMAGWEFDAVTLYERMRNRNPAPFAGYFAAHDEDDPATTPNGGRSGWAIVSASPERFLRVDGDLVETRPIKGTRGRLQTPEADLYSRDELRQSEKDRAENVMIVDLLRNDLSRVCRPGTVRVPELCRVETYQTVQHLVSVVTGRLEEGKTPLDLLAATFPGGSITGAPKVRAMEIITELERIARGPYCGSLFWLGLDGNFDSNILIRTVLLRDGLARFPVGGGVVYDSDPESEYRETFDKAVGMLNALDRK